jgi:hemerythrin superfamily protein
MTSAQDRAQDRAQDEQPDVVDLIMQDHREFERMFADLRTHPERRRTLGPVMATLLYAHERAEEAEVYPAAREAGGAEDVEHSQKEHLAADQLAEQLGEADPDSAEFGELLDKLMDAVQHHLEEEEKTVLPHMRERMSAERLDELGRAFLAARAEHLGGQQDDITRRDLQQQAENLDLSGSGSLSKDELSDRLSDEAEL